jgi:TatD DNase family protein
VALAHAHGARFGLRAGAGLHPAYIPTGSWTQELAAIERLAHEDGLAALGEVGLDTMEGTAPLETQVAVLCAQLEMARALALPVVLHMRGVEAEARGRDVLARVGTGMGAVLHYFTGDLAAARAWLDLGCHLSVGRPATRAMESALRLTLADPALPLVRLLVETDTYPLPGRRTEPADVVSVAHAVAALKGVAAEVVADATSANFTRLFERPAIQGVTGES